MFSTVPVWLSRLPSNETEVRFDYFLCSTSLGVLATGDSENASNRETEGLCIKVTTNFRVLPLSRSVRTASESGSSVNFGHALSYVLIRHSDGCPCKEGRRY